jgi:peptidoglycan/LPS O-acetylase OafA/YrhL
MITCPLKAGGLLTPWRHLGTVSYGLYLWHFPVLLSLLSLSGPRGGRLFVVMLAASVTLATLVLAPDGEKMDSVRPLKRPML